MEDEEEDFQRAEGDPLSKLSNKPLSKSKESTPKSSMVNQMRFSANNTPSKKSEHCSEKKLPYGIRTLLGGIN